MSERIILCLTAFHGPAEECAKLGKKIIDGILPTLLWCSSFMKRVIYRLILTQTDRLTSFLIYLKESMFLTKKNLKLTKDIRGHKFKREV